MRTAYLSKESLAPLAKGTRRDCEEYRENKYGEVDCSWLQLQVRMPDFVMWNPSLSRWNCTLANATRYCTKLGEGWTIIPNEEYILKYASVPSNAAPISTHDCYT